MTMFSRTVSSVSSVSCCGTTPRRARMRGPSRAGSRPRIRNVPPLTGETQPIMRIVELLPAPFGPRKPNASPRWTSKSIPSTAVSAPKRFTSPRAQTSGPSARIVARIVQTLAPRPLELRRSPLERFDELLELVLVGEDELDPPGRHLRVEAGERREGRAHALGERRIDRDGANARTLSRPRPLRPLLGGAHGEALADDLAGEPAALLVVGNGEHGARMALAELAALDHAEHVVGELEQADPVRDRRLRATDPLRHLAEREPELVDQDGVGARLLDRGELLARDVLDEPEQERVPVVRLPDDGRHRLPSGLARRPPAPLAGNDLVAASGARADEQRLDHALATHRLGEPRRRFGLEPTPRLARVRMDRVHGQLEQLARRRVEAAHQELETAAEPPPGAPGIRRARQAPSPPSSTRRRPPSGGRRRSPAGRSSAPPPGAPSAARTS